MGENSGSVFIVYLQDSSNYYKKYAMSTALLMWAYYGLPLPESKEGKMILLAIDSGFKGHYASSDYFKQIHTDHLEMLGLTELIDILNQTQIEHFYRIQKKFNLNAKIYIDETGYLLTNINLANVQGYFNFPIELPKEQFTLRNNFTNHITSVGQIGSKSSINRLVSFALVNKNTAKFTVA